LTAISLFQGCVIGCEVGEIAITEAFENSLLGFVETGLRLGEAHRRQRADHRDAQPGGLEKLPSIQLFHNHCSRESNIPRSLLRVPSNWVFQSSKHPLWSPA